MTKIRTYLIWNLRIWWRYVFPWSIVLAFDLSYIFECKLLLWRFVFTNVIMALQYKKLWNTNILHCHMTIYILLTLIGRDVHISMIILYMKVYGFALKYNFYYKQHPHKYVVFVYNFYYKHLITSSFIENIYNMYIFAHNFYECK